MKAKGKFIVNIFQGWHRHVLGVRAGSTDSSTHKTSNRSQLRGLQWSTSQTDGSSGGMN